MAYEQQVGYDTDAPHVAPTNQEGIVADLVE